MRRLLDSTNPWVAWPLIALCVVVGSFAFVGGLALLTFLGGLVP